MGKECYRDRQAKNRVLFRTSLTLGKVSQETVSARFLREPAPRQEVAWREGGCPIFAWHDPTCKNRRDLLHSLRLNAGIIEKGGNKEGEEKGGDKLCPPCHQSCCSLKDQFSKMSLIKKKKVLKYSYKSNLAVHRLGG